MNDNAASEAPDQLIHRVQSLTEKLTKEIGTVIVGQDDVIRQVIMAMLCRSHAVLVGVPGLAKTLLISTIARAMSLAFSRIQFTPDLMPADITGTEVIEEDRATGKREMRFVSRAAGGHPASALLLGTAFAFGWTPCIGPVLGAILTMSANTSEIGSGVILLAFYSLGLGLPFLAAAAFTGFFLNSMKSMRRIGKPFQIAAGVIMVAMGIAMVTGYLTSLAYWLLELVPGLATLEGALI